MPDFGMRRWELTPHPFLSAGEFIVVPAGTIHTFATVNDAPASVLVTMTPQIDAVVRELHEVPEDERAAVWARYDSRPV